MAMLVGASGARAQPSPTPPPAPAPAPAPAPVPAPPAAAASYRFTLADGRVVDAQLIGGDAQSYFIQTPAGTYSLARANVTSMMALPSSGYAPPPPLPMSAPPPPPVAMPPPAEEEPRSRAAGFSMFFMSYGLTALIAYTRTDNDPDAHLGYIPVIGPIIWTASDEGKWGEDGWDWLGALSMLSQGMGVYGMVAGIPEKKRRRGLFGVAPVRTSTFRGVAVSGTF
jgi:hypothetical protein